MCMDARKGTVWDNLRQRDLKAFRQWLRPEVIDQAARDAKVRFGQGPLHLGNLVWLSVAAAWHGSKNFAGVLILILKLLRDAPEWQASSLATLQRRGRQKARSQKRHKHDPRGQDPTVVSEEAFVQARRKVSWRFWVALLALLTDSFERAHSDQASWKGFRLLALDGSLIALPGWKKLADYFGTKSSGAQRRQKTMARLVMIQMPLVRMPWRYELTRVGEAESHVAARLLANLRVNDLLLMDRGFWSYGLFCQIEQQEAFFATRLKAGVRLRTLRKLGRDDRLVHYEPVDWRKKWKKPGWPKAISLRVIHYQIKGFRPSAVVTNVRCPQTITREDWVRMAVIDDAGRVIEPGLYHRRWEIETTFAELKVVQGMEGQLRSRTPEGIRFEVAGHVLLYLLIRWLLVEAAAKAGIDDPLRLSFKEALGELRDMYHTLLHAAPERVRTVLLPRLLDRIASHQVLVRPGRHYERPRDNYAKPGRSKRRKKARKEKAEST
jgi:Transposase DDE domain